MYLVFGPEIGPDETNPSGIEIAKGLDLGVTRSSSVLIINFEGSE